MFIKDHIAICPGVNFY